MSRGVKTGCFACALSLWMGCSLLELDDLELVDCRSDADCAVLASTSESAAESGMAGCYRCNRGRCEPHGPAEERAIGSIEEPRYLRYQQVDRDEAYLIAGHHTQDDRQAEGYVIAGAQVHAQATIDYDSWLPAARSGSPDAAYQCPSDDGSASACDVSDVALTALDSELVAGVAINRLGCSEGQVRVGLSDKRAPFRLKLGSPTGDGATDAGLAIDLRERDCTRDALGEVHGATAPAIAGLGGDSPEVLALWLASSAAEPAADACSKDAALSDLQAMRLRVNSSGEDRWLEAASDAPERLGRVLGRVAPSVVATKSGERAGYLLAYADDAAVWLKYVPALRLAAELGSELGSVRVSAVRAHHVGLSVGDAVNGSGTTVMLAWQSGCGSEAQLHVAFFEWTNGSELVQVESPRVITTGPLEGPVALAHQRVGHRLRGVQGGWSLAWIERASGHELELYGARIAQADFSLEKPGRLARGELSFPFLLSGDSPLAYGFLRWNQPAQAQLVIASCPATD